MGLKTKIETRLLTLALRLHVSRHVKVLCRSGGKISVCMYITSFFKKKEGGWGENNTQKVHLSFFIQDPTPII
jgi:hypothetical protein